MCSSPRTKLTHVGQECVSGLLQVWLHANTILQGQNQTAGSVPPAHCFYTVDTHSNPIKVSRAGALPVVELWPPDIKWNVVSNCKMGREGSQGRMIVNILLLLSSNWENTKCQKLWQSSNVFQYLNHNNIYMYQKKKLCAYVPNII